MIGNCRDCRWWEKNCDIRGNVWYSCGAIDTSYRNSAAVEGEATVYAYARDDSGLTAELRTGPTFGCVLFEEREND